MKDSLFEMLLSLFEQTLTKLKENHLTDSHQEVIEDNQANAYDSPPLFFKEGIQIAFVKSAQDNSIRVFTPYEQMKLTKASYQFLMRMLAWGVIDPEVLELVINQLIFSESRFVTLQETKWAIHYVLADSLDAEQLAFLDLLLYQTEDQFPLH